MKSIRIFFVLFFTTIYCIGFAQKFDAGLAKKLNADEYGMKNYILVILKTGPNKTTDKHKLDSLFRGHMNNIQQLSKAGKMIVAGPFEKNGNQFRGIFILDVKTKEEAVELLKSDPTVTEKIFEVEMYEWYGPAALPTYLKDQSKIEKKQH